MYSKLIAFLARFPLPLWYVVLFVLAVVPRTTAVFRYITPDELVWVYRSVQFSEALRTRQWVDSITSGHPGVITTWLGSLGIWLQTTLVPVSPATYDYISNLAWFVPDNMFGLQQLALFLTAGRLMVILFNSLLLVVIFYLLQKLFPFSVALVSALLLAFDPFLAALTGLLHVDATMTMLATISLLALATALQTGQKRPFLTLFLSGWAAGMSLLTKSPAILLPVLTALWLFIHLLTAPHQSGWWAPARQFVVRGLCWLAGWGAALWLLLPALWVSIPAVSAQISGDASRHIEDALRPTFFMGTFAVEHGLTFYPIAILYRLTPVVTLGLLVGVWLLLRSPRPSIKSALRHPVTLFLLWSLLFVVGISLAAKKFDRYALPIFPALTITAVYTWSRLSTNPRLLGGVTAVQLATFLFFWPYPYSAYNLLLGGPWTAQYVMPMGWGESIGEATRWVADQPESEFQTATASIAPSIAPFFPGRTVPFTDEFIPQADWLIVTHNDRLANPAIVPTGLAPVYTVRFGRLPQAWVYQQPDPLPNRFVPQPLPETVQFGQQLALSQTAVRPDAEQVTILLTWQRLTELMAENGRFRLKLTLTDPAGVVWTELETELLNDIYLYPPDWHNEPTTVRYALNLTPGMPPETYLLSLSLVEANSGNLLPVLGADGAFAGTAVHLGDLAVPLADSPVAATRLQIDQPVFEPLPAGLMLLGWDALPDSRATGEFLDLHLYWQRTAEPLPDIELTVQIGSTSQTQPLSRYPTSQWRAGEVVHEWVRVPISPDAAPGAQPVRVTAVFPDEQSQSIPLGDVEIVSVERNFTLPENLTYPLFVRWSEQIVLRGAEIDQTAVSPGDTVNLTLYWEVLTPPTELVTAFVHLLNPDGSNLTQTDQWPGGLPTNLWAPGQIIVDRHSLQIPPDAPTGTFPLGSGLYFSDTGVRLAGVAADQTAVPDNRFVLPVTIEVQSP